ncbi:hypothetical protein [Lichenicoccus sp.]|uniref:hypothetical protein n=1 Tax=Lichenicoccus sp. TaxID=2781899 RepID=UPI003D140D32
MNAEPSAADALARLQQVLSGLHGSGAAVAVSGGIDSLTLSAAAHVSLGAAVVMHHATSPAVPEEATGRTRALAHARGWRLAIFDAGEFADADYRANPVNRCFFCKTSLYGSIVKRLGATGVTVLSGTNTDDLGDYRPGLQAARLHGVRHPFVEAGIDKATVRRIARLLGLGTLAELPSAPCLSSRIETGIAIEPATLALVHDVERTVTRRLRPATVRCRVRAEGMVVELDAPSLEALPAGRSDLLREIEAMARRAGELRPVRFAPYRTGSAFLTAR